jgi:hypothetical protein
MFLLTNEILTDLNVPMGHLLSREHYFRFMDASLAQMGAGTRAVDRNFAPLAAADRANSAINAGAMPLRASLVTDFALDGHRQVSSSSYYHEVNAAN